MKEIRLFRCKDFLTRNASKQWCKRLLELATSSKASDKEAVDYKDDRADDGNGARGASEIHSRGVRRPVVSLLCVTPVLQNRDSTGGEEDRTDKVQECCDFPWNAVKQIF